MHYLRIDIFKYLECTSSEFFHVCFSFHVLHCDVGEWHGTGVYPVSSQALMKIYCYLLLKIDTKTSLSQYLSNQIKRTQGVLLYKEIHH